MKQVTIKLEHPIELKNDDGAVIETVSELTFRPVKAKDLRRCKESTERHMAFLIELAGYLCGQRTQVIDELWGADLGKVLEVTGDFFPSFQKPGETP